LPEGIFGNETPYQRAVITGSEEDEPRLRRVFLGLVGVFGGQGACLGCYVAEGVIVVGLDDGSCGVGYLVDVA
jgi:hypothetical protein